MNNRHRSAIDFAAGFHHYRFASIRSLLIVVKDEDGDLVASIKSLLTVVAADRL